MSDPISYPSYPQQSTGDETTPLPQDNPVDDEAVLRLVESWVRDGFDRTLDRCRAGMVPRRGDLAEDVRRAVAAWEAARARGMGMVARLREGMKEAGS